MSLRDSEEEIRISVESVFGKRRVIPSSLRDCVDEYCRLPDIKPYLTRREIAIVRYAAEGKTVNETASALMLSRRTVTSHLCNVYQKFGTRNKVEVLKLAISKGILSVKEIMAYATRQN